MLRTTTTYRHDLNGNVTQSVAEQEEIHADVPECTLPPADDGCGNKACTLCYPNQPTKFVNTGITSKAVREPSTAWVDLKRTLTPLAPAGDTVRKAAAVDTVRSTYRELSKPEKATLAAMKARGEALITAIKESAPTGREKQLALTKVEEAVMWATKAITT